MYQIVYTLPNGRKAVFDTNWLWNFDLSHPYLFETENAAKAIASTWIKVQLGNESFKYVTIEEV